MQSLTRSRMAVMRLMAPARAMQRTMVQQNQVRNFMNLNRVQSQSVIGTQMMRNFSSENTNPPSAGIYIENISTIRFIY